eukprot:6465212-Amphidinium_carterae.1
MEIRTTYKQTHDMIIADKQAYKQHHFHDFSIITSDKDLDEEYAKLMSTEYYKQARSKKNKPGHENSTQREHDSSCTKQDAHKTKSTTPTITVLK